MLKVRKRKEQRVLKKGGLPHHVHRSASQLHRMKGIIENLLSPYTRNVKIYTIRSSKRKRK